MPAAAATSLPRGPWPPQSRRCNEQAVGPVRPGPGIDLSAVWASGAPAVATPPSFAASSRGTGW
eukprot:8454401-Pyramimonas_sp.AAC.1